DGVAADIPSEVEPSARVVGRTPARRQPAQVEAGADVVRSAVIGHDVRHLKRRVELEPVRAGRPESVEVADVDGRNAWIVVTDVTVEAGNAEVGAGCGQPVD